MYFTEEPFEFSSPTTTPFTPRHNAHHQAKAFSRFHGLSFFVLLTLLCLALFGCGGGYPGLGLTGLSASKATIDAGQAFTLRLNETGTTLPVTWTVQCPAASCGSLSGGSTTGIYTAPAFLAAPIQVSVTATITGTSTAYTSTITVNPAPIITAAPPSGVVGVSYSTTFTTSGGTGTVKLSMAGGTLPPGLTMNGETNTLSGTPTTVGTSTFILAATDQSDVPFTVMTMEHVTITAPGAALTLLGGNPPSGIVGVSYSTALTAAGGTSPYTYTVLSGSLPSGLTLGASTGIISGVPTAQGTYTFTAQVQDAAGAKATASFSITISAATQALQISVSSLPDGTVGVAYSSTIGVTGGTAPYSCTITSGTLPSGLTLGSGCVVSGTPTTAGAVTLTVQATDSASPSATTSGPVSLTIHPAPVTLILTSPASGTVGTPYTGTIGVSGGTGPYTCALKSGTLQAGLTFNTNCTITGTPTASGSNMLSVQATDSLANTITGNVTVTIGTSPLTITTGTLPGGTVGTPYSSTIGVSGGTSPYSCTITSGTLPAGLTLGAGCVVSGTPTVAETANLTVKATDSSSPQQMGSGPVSITISPATVTLVLNSPPNGNQGQPYTGSIPVTGGTGPYTCIITAGTLPNGLTLNSNCTITGTPLTAGSSPITVKATDSSSPANTNTGSVTLTINPLVLSLTSPPNGTVGLPYTGSIGVSGGTAPYSCVLKSGTLEAGLTLNANCSITGTPTAAGSSVLSIQATDANTISTTGNVTVTIGTAPVVLTTGTLPTGTVGTPYSSTIGVTGGTSPYSCTVTSGALPAGLNLGAGCVVSGTPTTAGTANLTVKATDSSSPQQSGSGPVSITIDPAGVTLVISTPPNGTQNEPYTGSIPVTGGTGPYTCSLTAGPLPTGLTLNNNCTITGTPTTPGSSPITVKATDSSSPANTNTGSVTLTIDPLVLTLTSPPNGMVGAPYTGSVGVSGGTSPYHCTLASGSVPAGLTLNTDCSLTGTPTTAGTSTANVTVTDAKTPADTTTAPVTITITPASILVGNPPPATAGDPYTGTIPVNGGIPPYHCALASGTLPAGLSLNANCTITGTPTGPGTTTITVTVTDGNSPVDTTNAPVTITVNAAAPLTFTGSLQNGIVNVAYTQTLAASGGVPPYTYAVTAGTLPAGITLSTTGVVSGTPTTVGASSFTVTATDSGATPQTAALPLVLLITYPTTPNDSLLNGPYAFLFQGYDNAVLGLLAYSNATVGSFTADGTGVLTTGELDSNHQTSAPTGATVATSNLIGTYTIGSDDRGSLTIATLNADGTVLSNTTYAIVVKAPTTGTVSQAGSMIQDDNALLVGARGSGTFLAQTASAFSTGLTGSYAFGLSGDSPCLVSCTANLGGGPVAAVGRFTVGTGGAFNNGATDANIGAVNYPNSLLNGSVTAADANGRAQLTLANLGVPNGDYPVDFAAYVVNATTTLVMSTDKHSAYILLAGSATQQTAPTFSNASLTGAFVGYENAPTNPGLVGATLQNVLNLSTATIFRGTDSGSGVCNTTNVDQGGVTGLVNGLTGLGSGATLLNDLLGTYASTGTSVCTAATNGRAILNYPVPSTLLSGLLGLLGVTAVPPAPRVAYLTGTNAGYFLESGYAGLGRLENQTGAPFSLATLNGTYTYGTTPAASVASIDGSGTFTADGAGHATSTLDTVTIGVGNINVISLGVGGSYNYTLTDANAGRYLLGTTTVIYAISPNRFVLLDESPLTTSPSVALIY